MDARCPSSSPEKVMQRHRTRWLFIAVAGFAIVGGVATAYWWLYARNYEGTDDSYVAGDLVNVSSQISGTVVSIDADETDFVQMGQELVRLDATDARIPPRAA